jgi:hypothetical protein
VVTGGQLPWLLRRAALLLGVASLVGAALPPCGADYREVECFAEGAETCGKMTYCRPDRACTAGCENDRECEESRPAAPYCQKEAHLCVACRTGADCGEGEFCLADGSCGAGCDDGQNKPCPTGQLCCNHVCADPTSSELHCGRCDAPCGTGAECCASACVDTFDFLGDASNCGGCGVRCVPGLHSTQLTCDHGSCLYQCDPGYADCDPKIPGCESDLTAVTSCGGCEHQCNTVGSDMRCVPDEGAPGKAQCAYTKCLAGFADCDEGANPDNGCEADLSTPGHCGECSAACATVHGQPQCQNGTCVYASCEGDWADCRGASAENPHNLDGCESDLNALGSCGACGTSCSSAHGTAHCTMQRCAYECQPSWGDCQTAGSNSVGCETDLSDASNCGGCGVVCGSLNATGSTCQSSEGSFACAYTCLAPYADCTSQSGCETNLSKDAENCGGCGVACDAAHTSSGSATCAAGKCQYTACATGFADCDEGQGTNENGCETSLSTPTDCGGCHLACPDAGSAHATTPPVCSGGTCQYGPCAEGYGDCNDGQFPGNFDGCETSLSTVSNCAGCAQACDTVHSDPSGCDGARCLYAGCKAGWTNCSTAAPDTDGCDTNTESDPANCGGCGVVCDGTHTASGKATCVEGKCQYTACASGFADCSTSGSNPVGCETQIASDAANCGACGNACSAAGQANATAPPACSAGVCTYACTPGFISCNSANGNADGCETSLTSASSCGGCGVSCDGAHASSTSCDGASCQYTCAPGWNDCKKAGADADGCETPTGPDACGGCQACANNASVQARACSGGKCSYTCSAGYGNCNAAAPGVDADGCECKKPLYGDPSSPGGCCGAGCMKVMQTGLTPEQVQKFPLPTDWQPGTGWAYPANEPPSSTYLTCSTLTAQEAAQKSCLAATKPGFFAPPYQYQDHSQICSDSYIRYLPASSAKQAGGYCQPMHSLAPFGNGTVPCACWFFYSGLDFNAIGKVSFSMTGCRAPVESDPTFTFNQ